MPEPVEITFLGTGAAVPTVKRGHSAILLSYKGNCMLFDCGEGAQIQLQKAKVSPLKISNIFITHWHADHFSGLLPLIETMHLLGRKKPLTICGPEASRFVDALIELSYWGVGFKINAKDVDVEKKKSTVFGNEDCEIIAIKTRHSVPSCGFAFKERDRWNFDRKKIRGLEGPLLGKLKAKKSIKLKGKTIKLSDMASLTQGRKVVYSGDTMAYESFFAEAKNADLLIHDSTFIEPEEKRAHASASEVATLSKKYGIKKLALTHFSKRYQNPKEVLEKVRPIFKNSIIAEDMMKTKV